MDTKNIIDALGGCQSVANILNEQTGLRIHTRQRIFNWYKSGKIPAWAQLAHKKVWDKGLKLSRNAD